MNTDLPVPPTRDLPAERVAARRAHLLSEIESEQMARGHRRLSSPAVAVPVAIALVAVVALLLVAPWQRAGLVDRALAAVGGGPVLHIVVDQPSPYGYKATSISTGRSIPLTLRQEIWFDQSRDLKKTVSTLNGRPLAQLLETRDGGYGTDGFVYTCPWIAAHPVEAAQARVSCNSDGESAPTPSSTASQRPALDLAVAGFVDHYRSALKSGRATQIRRGQLDGHHVIWLAVTTGDTNSAELPAHEDVAIDSATYKPILVRMSDPSGVEFRIIQIETQPFASSAFSRPRRVATPSAGNVASSSRIPITASADALGGHALTLGSGWKGFQLASAERQHLTTGYDSTLNREPQHSQGLVLNYVRSSARRPASIQIHEATRCELAYVWRCDAHDPSGDTMLSGLPFSTSIFKKDGVYISVNTSGRAPNALEVARSLHVAER